MPKPPPGRADYLELSSWNAICYFCGRKRKSTDMKKQWQGFWVCKEEWEPRQPQDFVKNVVDNQAPPWSQPPAAPVFIGVCTVAGRNALPGVAIPHCAVPHRNNPFTPPGGF